MKPKRTPSVLERFLFSNPNWQEGYKSFHRLFGRPLAWAFVADEEGGGTLMRLDRKGNCTMALGSEPMTLSSAVFHQKYGAQLLSNEDALPKLPGFYKDTTGKNGVLFALRHLGKLRGFLFLCAFSRPERAIRDMLFPFDHFLTSHVELAFKSFELNNFYETVHPRALALSTMHSVHRVISSSLRLNELLPRIGRLSAQVLKAKGCSIMLMEPEHDYLMPYWAAAPSECRS
jgi:hypothetical protein